VRGFGGILGFSAFFSERALILWEKFLGILAKLVDGFGKPILVFPGSETKFEPEGTPEDGIFEKKSPEVYKFVYICYNSRHRCTTLD
jgi:hypothetical protein